MTYRSILQVLNPLISKALYTTLPKSIEKTSLITLSIFLPRKSDKMYSSMGAIALFSALSNFSGQFLGLFTILGLLALMLALAIMLSKYRRARNRASQLDAEKQTLENELQETKSKFEEKIREVENQQLEEQNRAWAATGTDQINKLIRNIEVPQELAEKAITQLIKYLGANQGSIFLVEKEGDGSQEESKTILKLSGTYAYERKKYISKELSPGEGLVGQCYLEKEMILLNEVPENYIYITSGLGQATPRCVAILPLVHNEEVEGVMEIATFKPLAPFQVAFLKQAAETLAASIRMHKINYQTKYLLKLSQEQKEEMLNQAEELRQNMEEIQATQEEVVRKNVEMEEKNRQLLSQEEALKHHMGEIQLQKSELEDYVKKMEKMSRTMAAREKVINASTILSESDLYGTITYVNDKLCEVSKYSREELIGKPHKIFRHEDMPKEVFKLLWEKIKKGEMFRGIIKNKAKDGSVYWVDAIIAPELDKDGKPIKFIGVRYVIEDEILAERLFSQMLEKLGIGGLVIGE